MQIDLLSMQDVYDMIDVLPEMNLDYLEANAW